MQEKIQFWNDWKSLEKNVFYILILLLFSLLALTIIAKWKGNENIMAWDIVAELNEKLAPTDNYEEGNLNFQTSEKVFYVKEKYVPTGVQLKNFSSWVYIICLFLGISLVLSALLRQKSSWFMVAILILGGILMSIRLEILFNLTNNFAFLLPFLIIGGTAYYFNSWSKKQNVFLTLPVFLVLFLLLLLCCIYFSQVALPVASLAHFGIMAGLVITFILTFFIAHEIIAGIAWIATIRKGNSMITFVVASVIYLLNTVLIYLENSNRIEKSLTVIDPLLLFICSLIIGFGGFYRFCQQTEIFSFRQTGSWLYLGAALISIATLVFIYTSANDPLIELTNDFIAIAHLVGGTVFFIHTLLNFWPLFQRNAAVYKVLYKPQFTKLIVARIFMVLGIVFVFSAKGDFSIRQWVAGQANAIGDYHLLTDDLFTAEAYYKQSLNFDDRNHKANYSLASLAFSQGDKTTAAFYFKQANLKNPSEFAYLALSEILLQEDLFFDAIFVLQDAEKHFPKSSKIASNIGQLYEKAQVLDSAYLYYDKAYQNCKKCEVETTNLLAFWINNARIEKLDSAVKEIPVTDDIAVKANQASCSKLLKKSTEITLKIPPDSLLNVSEFACLFNLQTNRKLEKPLVADETMRNLQLKPENVGYFEDLLFARSKQNYWNGDKREAIKQLAYIIADSTTDNRSNAQLLGVWFLEEGVYNKAITYFSYAQDTTTLQVLRKQNFATYIDEIQFEKANALEKNKITIENYENFLNKAPYNSYIIEKVVEVLNKNKQETKAYQAVFDAVKINDENALLWQLYVMQATKIGVNDYAQDGLLHLKKLLSSAAYDTFLLKYEAAKKDTNSQDFY